jgi:hypothetical protein
MKKVILCALVAVFGIASGCVKSSTDASVKGDGSFVIKLSARYMISAHDKNKAVPDDCTCWKVYQIHELSVPAARRALLAFEAEWDPKKITDRWTRLGLNVSKAALSEDDGWRVIDVEASGANIADVHAKLAAELKAAGKDEYLTALPWFLHTRKLLPRLPRFIKTADPTVVKAVIAIGDVGSELGALAELTEDERSILGKQLTYMKAMRMFKHGELKVRMKLPGTITSVENARPEGTDGLVFELQGDAVDPEAVSAQAKAKGLITATLKVDPKAFTIPLAAE